MALPLLRARGIDVDFYSFGRLWQEGLPAREGQSWLSTRFHFHLLAAAAGARGAVIELDPAYYGVKHGSLRDLGTGWAHLASLDPGADVVATVNDQFSDRVADLGARKADVAKRIYQS